MKSPLKHGILANWNVLIYFQMSKGAKLLQNSACNLVDLVAVHRKAKKKDTLSSSMSLASSESFQISHHTRLKLSQVCL